jgi:hypothetical protein
MLRKALALVALIVALLIPVPAFAVNHFWVGGTGTWDGSDTTHWSLSSGGAGGASVPGVADNVSFDGNSGGGTVTVATNFSILALTTSVHTGTLDFSVNNNTVAMTAWLNSSSTARGIIPGTATFNVSGNGITVWSWSTVTNLTVTNPGTATVNFTYSGSVGTRTIAQGGVAGTQIGSMNVTAGTDTVNFSSGPIATNYNFTGFAGTLTGAATASIFGNLTFSAGMTQSHTGAWTFSGSAQTITSNGKSFGAGFTFFSSTQDAAVTFADAATIPGTLTNTNNGVRHILTLPAGATVTVGLLANNGATPRPGVPILTMRSSSSSAATFAKTGGSFSALFNLDINNITASPSGSLRCTDCLDRGGNTGIVFLPGPGVVLMMGM